MFEPVRLDAAARLRLDFVIAGAPKSGTSFLHEALRQNSHLELLEGEITTFMPLHYSPQAARKLLKRFKAPQKLHGIKRPDYVFVFRAMQNIKNACGAPKILIVARDPVVRLISHFYHLRALGQVKLCAFEEFAAVYTAGDLITLGHRAHELRHHSEIGDAIGFARDLFGPDNVKVLNFEAMTANPEAVLQDACAFLGAPYEPVRFLPFIPQQVIYDEEWQKWNARACRIEGVCDENGIVISYRKNPGPLRRIAARYCRLRGAKHRRPGKPTFSRADLLRLRDHFAPIYAFLEREGLVFSEFDRLADAGAD